MKLNIEKTIFSIYPENINSIFNDYMFYQKLDKLNELHIFYREDSE